MEHSIFVEEDEVLLRREEEPPLALEGKELLLIEDKEPLLHETNSLELLPRGKKVVPLGILFLIVLYGVFHL